LELPKKFNNTGLCHEKLKETIKHNSLIIWYNVELAKHFVKKLPNINDQKLNKLVGTLLPKQATKAPFFFGKRNGVFFWLLLRSFARH
jgi:hypothetical protein